MDNEIKSAAIGDGETAGEIKEKTPFFATRAALISAIIAAASAIVLLIITGFGAFKMIGGGSELTRANIVSGRYLTFNVDMIIDYLAEDYNENDEVVGRYAIVPVEGELAVVHLPERYLESGDEIAMQTYYLLYGMAELDEYFVVSGTVKSAPAEIADEYADWYVNNSYYVYSAGLISGYDQTAIEYMVEVDTAGNLKQEASVALTVSAGVLIIYAAAAFIFVMKARRSDGISVELYEYEGRTQENEVENEL